MNHDTPVVNQEGIAGRPVWAVWRQDDNGARFEVARFEEPEPAHALAVELAARGHKQLYWVTPP